MGHSPKDALVVRQQDANGLADATFLHFVSWLDVHAVDYLQIRERDLISREVVENKRRDREEFCYNFTLR